MKWKIISVAFACALLTAACNVEDDEPKTQPRSQATCFDGMQNQDEQGVDCGGPCAQLCEPPATCVDDIKNQGEQDVDCGGPCAACQAAATCADGVQNQGEQGVDCGGPCAACQAAATCFDGLQNQGEQGIDCGGPCAACPTQARCGDGVIQRDAGEQCDETPKSDCAYGQQSCMVCNDQCRLVAGSVTGFCGDGIVQSVAGEQCDEPIKRDCEYGELSCMVCDAQCKRVPGVPIPTGFRLIQAGSYMMGSPPSEPDRGADEGQVQVTLTKPFYIQETEVTQSQWRSIMGNNPSSNSTCGDSCPVERVSWYEALAYLNALSASQGLETCYNLSFCSGTIGTSYTCTQVTWTKGLDCEGYRLPTEAEWEYAARASTTGARYGNLNDIAWYAGNNSGKTRPVKGKQPNAWGLYDILGNVWEWTWDEYSGQLAGGLDPIGGALLQNNSANRVDRGCSWGVEDSFCRAAFRGGFLPDGRGDKVGLRPARSNR